MIRQPVMLTICALDQIFNFINILTKTFILNYEFLFDWLILLSHHIYMMRCPTSIYHQSQTVYTDTTQPSHRQPLVTLPQQILPHCQSKVALIANYFIITFIKLDNIYVFSKLCFYFSFLIIFKLSIKYNIFIWEII